MQLGRIKLQKYLFFTRNEQFGSDFLIVAAKILLSYRGTSKWRFTHFYFDSYLACLRKAINGSMCEVT